VAFGLMGQRPALPMGPHSRTDRPGRPGPTSKSAGQPIRPNRDHTRRGGVDAGGLPDIEAGRGAQGMTGGVRPTQRQGG
jgi:hypothetical protein